MSVRLKVSWLVVVSLLFASLGARAQTDGTFGGFSPYSVFGIGQLHQGGTAWNRGMGGVGVAARNNRFVNIMNPAAVTARDSLSFMADFGLSGRIAVFSEGDKKASNTIFNIDDFVISFPMWNHTAFMAGIRPVSDVGYNINTSFTDLYTGRQNFVSKGSGGMYQVFLGAGITLWDRLSLGAQFNYNFGNINKKASLSYSDASYRTSNTGDSLQVNNLGAKFGLQYAQRLSNSSSLTLGATYQLSTQIRGYSIHYRELGSYDRTRAATTLDEHKIMMGDELSVGISYKLADKFMAEVDYTRSDWSRSRLDQVAGFSNVGDVTFAPAVGQSIRAGVEYTPNRSDIRYYLKRCTYRGGAYFEQSHYTVGGQYVNSVGLTLGITLPVFRWYNGLSLGIDVGRKGLSGNQVKETFFGFNIGMNVFDIWFQKRPYE